MKSLILTLFWLRYFLFFISIFPEKENTIYKENISINSAIIYIQWTILGLHRETGEHPSRLVFSLGVISDARWHSRWDGPSFGYGGERYLQESGLAIRANTPRSGGLRWIRCLFASRDLTATYAWSLLGGLHWCFSAASRWEISFILLAEMGEKTSVIFINLLILIRLPSFLGNMTDTEKLRDTRSECGASRGRNGRMRRSSRDAVSACGERSVDRLYLRAAANARTKGSRHTLLIIRSDYEARGTNALTVSKGDVVALLSDHVSDWFWVRSRDGREGFIPAVIAGHGFLWPFSRIWSAGFWYIKYIREKMILYFL